LSFEFLILIWTSLVNNVKYRNGDFVYVTNDKTIAQDDAASKNPKQQSELQLSHYWIAKILEIRALNGNRFARVYWMYFPDDLPSNTLDEEELASGRQQYYGKKELVASNHSEPELFSCNLSCNGV
jgi:hypothetical protein